jgi:predicted MFS family arabinose efflux permease
VLGGVLTDLLSWRWAFLVNVPIALLVVAVAPFVLRDSADRERSRLDLPGAVLVTSGLLALVYGATRLGEAGIADVWGLASIGAAVVLLIAFWRAESTHPHPLVPLHILTRRTIGFGNIAGFATFAFESSLVFVLTMYLQHVLGLDALQTGLMLVAMGAGAIIGGSVGPRVIEAFGVRNTVAGGLAIQAVTTGALVLIGPSVGWLWFIGLMNFIGAIGHVSAIVGFMVAATSGLPDHEQGLATGLAMMTQQVAIALGIPIMSTVATAAGGVASLGALQVAIAVNAVLVLVAALLVAVGLPRRS